MFGVRRWVSVGLAAGAFVFLWVGTAASSSVVINEIMYAPASGGCEWIELWNTSTQPLTLGGWTLEDSRGKPSLVSADDLGLGAESFLVLAANQESFLAEFGWVDPSLVRELSGSWPTLNNSQSSDHPYADIVLLRDASGTTVDAVAYEADWGVSGYSIERLSPGMGAISSNWCPSLAAERATPAEINSAYLGRDSTAGLAAEPDPFRPFTDGVTFVSFNIPLPEPTVRIQVFDVLGRMVRTLLDDRPAGQSGRLAWDGTTDAGARVPTGIYILYLQALDQTKGRVIEEKATVAVIRD